MENTNEDWLNACFRVSLNNFVKQNQARLCCRTAIGNQEVTGFERRCSNC